MFVNRVLRRIFEPKRDEIRLQRIMHDKSFIKNSVA
jgi:hypothetical protein